MSGFYASNGSINVTVVNTAPHGVYAADGSINVTRSLGPSGPGGAYSPSGAWYVTNTSSPVNTRRAPDGSLYVSSTGAFGAQPITIVSGSFGGGSPTPGSNAWFFLLGI